MKTTNRTIVLALALLLVAALAIAQDASKPSSQQKPADTAADNAAKPERGQVEFGVRQIWGDEYGRPDLPFRPGIQNSKYNEYRDVRNGFFIRRFRVDLEDFLGTKNYVSLQSRNSIYKDQSYLATFGRWGKYKVQFRYDEIPHTFTNTARTLFTTTAPGVYTISPLIRSSLQASQALTTLPSMIQTQVVPGMQFITPALERRNGSLLATYSPTAEWTLWTSVSREHMSGTRPLGAIFNSSPSAATTGGDGVEIPEPINYFTTNVRIGTEYGRESWGVQLSYLGSFFENRIDHVTFDNPFRTTDCVAPNGCTAATQGPAAGRLDLYPDNTAHYLTFAGAVGLNKKIHLMASINPGWLRQNDQFLPYTSNSILLAQTGPLPATSLHGQKTTLAMNYTLVANPFKHIQVKAGFRDYDYSNDTPIRTFTPVQGDFGAPNLAGEENTPFAYNRKTFEATGNYYFGKKSSFKAGYVGEWMDRTHRDVAHTLENSFITSLDLVPHKNFSFRLAYRHAVRDPEAYEDDAFDIAGASGGITEEQINHRRFDEAARVRNRFDASASWDATDRLSFTVFGGSTQDDYNRRGGVNSPTALNFLTTTTKPYYLYGVLKDIGNNFGVDADFALSNAVSLFAEYSREYNHKRMVSRYRVPGAATIPNGTLAPPNCAVSTSPCDSANNDWESTTRDMVDVWTAGTDLYLGKKIYFTVYYSLSAGKGNVDSRPLGDTTLLTGPNKFLLTGTNAAVPYPETTNRLHEIVAIYKFHLTKNLMPKVEYRFQQWDNRDYQTSAMTPYMGCVSPVPNGPPVTNAVPGCTAPILLTNTPFPVGNPSPFYPFFTVGDPSAARYLFLGADQPSYRVHYASVTLEYHF